MRIHRFYQQVVTVNISCGTIYINYSALYEGLYLVVDSQKKITCMLYQYIQLYFSQTSFGLGSVLELE